MLFTLTSGSRHIPMTAYVPNLQSETDRHSDLISIDLVLISSLFASLSIFFAKEHILLNSHSADHEGYMSKI